MREGILRLGNAQLAEVGAAALSVREIARGLGVASSAIYRHVANRDELLTLLIVDAYDDLAEAALRGPRTAASADRLASIALGMRGWAVANPARWALAYGTPVPGYDAPSEQTTASGTRVLAAFLETLSCGSTPKVAGAPKMPQELGEVLTAGAAELGLETDPELGLAAIGAWTGLIGMVSAEIFQQLGPELASHGEVLLNQWIADTVDRFGLEHGRADRSGSPGGTPVA